MKSKIRTKGGRTIAAPSGKGLWQQHEALFGKSAKKEANMTSTLKVVKFQFEDGHVEERNLEIYRRRNQTYYVRGDGIKDIVGALEKVDVAPYYDAYHPSKSPLYFTADAKSKSPANSELQLALSIVSGRRKSLYQEDYALLGLYPTPSTPSPSRDEIVELAEAIVYEAIVGKEDRHANY